VDENQTGTYTVTYTVADKAGNVGTATKAVIVRNDAYLLEGNYAVVDLVNSQTTNYTEIIRLSETVNNRIFFNKFGNYSGNNTIYANITGNDITVPPGQTATVAGATRVFGGSGVKNSQGFIINYSEVTNGSTVQGVGTYVKQ
jgi:hypothetical protein